jgi:hypothetical protein
MRLIPADAGQSTGGLPVASMQCRAIHRRFLEKRCLFAFSGGLENEID